MSRRMQEHDFVSPDLLFVGNIHKILCRVKKSLTTYFISDIILYELVDVQYHLFGELT